MIVENKDAFEISETDFVVTTCRSDSSSAQLEIRSSDMAWTLTIEGVSSVRRDTHDAHRSAIGELTDLVGEVVLSLRALKTNAELELKFTHGWMLTVQPDVEYEAWEMLSSRGDRLVAVPGDGIASWLAKA